MRVAFPSRRARRLLQIFPCNLPPSCIMYISYIQVGRISTYQAHDLSQGKVSKSHRNPPRYLGHAHPPGPPLGAAPWICAQQGHSHRLGSDSQGGYRIPLSSPPPLGTQRLDRRRMESVGIWPAAEDLSPDEIWAQTVSRGTLSLGPTHGSH